MIRPLIWIAAGLVLSTILYNAFARYKAHDAVVRAEARQVAGIPEPAAKGAKATTVAAASPMPSETPTSSRRRCTRSAAR